MTTQLLKVYREEREDTESGSEGGIEDTSLGQETVGYRFVRLEIPWGEALMAIGEDALAIRTSRFPTSTLNQESSQWSLAEIRVNDREDDLLQYSDIWRNVAYVGAVTTTFNEITLGTGAWVWPSHATVDIGYVTSDQDAPTSHPELLALGEILPDEGEELLGLLNLPHNWDLEDGQPATELAIIVAATTIRQIYEVGLESILLTSITAAADGGVEMTWEGAEGYELFVVVPPNGQKLRYVYSERIENGKYTDIGGVLETGSNLKSLIHGLMQ